MHGKEIKNYMIEKYDWSNEIFNYIDWETMGECLEKVQGLCKVTIYKLTHLRQAVNLVVQRNEKGKKMWRFVQNATD